jgi:hypothetical protein
MFLVCNVLAETVLAYVCSVSLVSKIQNSSSALELRTAFFGIVAFFSCNFLAETTKVGPSIILSCLVSELQKPPSQGLEPRNFFGVFSYISSWF